MSTPPPWAKSCRNPYIRHQWDWIPIEYTPDTCFPWVRIFNERCTECGLIAARMVSDTGVRHSLYKTSTYPKDYRYTELEAPTAIDYMDWRIEVAEERYAQRERRKAKRSLEVVA